MHPPHPCNVVSIDCDGITYTRARNVWIRNVNTNAVSTNNGNSRQKEPFRFVRRPPDDDPDPPESGDPPGSPPARSGSS
nr:hypothetical protein GCM10020241_50540 [Streptoalloteichus tenebrarius]BFF03813.1 hypothetical protein GCM10020241_54880 [Streptoalloteichus tenebrarius]